MLKHHSLGVILLTLMVVSLLSVSSSLFHIFIANNFHTVLAQAKTNRISLPFFIFPQPEKIISPMVQQQQQRQHPQQPTQGFMLKGTVNSLIKTPTADWIASGNWTLNLNYNHNINHNIVYFKTDMTWFNNNGKTSHTHEFQNFRFNAKSGNTTGITPQPGNNVILNGVMDVGTNHRIVWKNVPTTININGGKTIAISVADNATNHHFAGQPVFGLVRSFVPHSK
jgi:hypothetical protein